MISNFAGKLYNQYDNIIRELSSAEELKWQRKKFFRWWFVKILLAT